MAIKYEQIEAVNKEIKTTDIKGKDYAEVPQRVNAFRKLYPQGSILTEMLSNENGVCVMKAIVKDGGLVLATGTAYEKEGSTFINKQSYIENCETSAVGRALGFLGLGIDTSIASADEVGNAIANQGDKREPAKATPTQVAFLKVRYEGENLKKLLEKNRITKIEDLPMEKASDLIARFKAKENKDE